MLTDKERIIVLETQMENVEKCLSTIDGKLDKLLKRREKGNDSGGKGMLALTLMNVALMVATIGVVAILVFH